jgi:hypothetical protein
MADKIIVDANHPLEIEWLDERYDARARSVLSVAADPSDPSGATPLITFAATAASVPAASIVIKPVATIAVRGATLANDTDLGGLPSFNASGGPGPGKTLTATANGALVLDDVTYEAGDKILFKGRITGSTTRLKQHGVYLVVDAGSASAPWILVRDESLDSNAEAVRGVVVTVSEGTENAGTSWVLSTSSTGIDVGLRLFFNPYDLTSPTSIDAAGASFQQPVFLLGDATVSGDLGVNTINGSAYPPPATAARAPIGSEYEFFGASASTALDPAKLMSEIALDGLDTGAFTLAAGTSDGQEKWIVTSQGGNNAPVTVTGAFRHQNLNFTTITFNGGHQGVRMFWEVATSKWCIRPGFGVGSIGPNFT